MGLSFLLHETSFSLYFQFVHLHAYVFFIYFMPIIMINIVPSDCCDTFLLKVLSKLLYSVTRLVVDACTLIRALFHFHGNMLTKLYIFLLGNFCSTAYRQTYEPYPNYKLQTSVMEDQV